MLFSQSVSSASISSVWRAIPRPSFELKHGSAGAMQSNARSQRATSARVGFSRGAGNPFQDVAADLLGFAEPREILLKIAVEVERQRRIELRTQYHVAQMNWMRQHSIVAQFFERGNRIIVIHMPSPILRGDSHSTWIRGMRQALAGRNS